MRVDEGTEGSVRGWGWREAAARMVEGQIRARGVRNGRVLAALAAVDRSAFVPAESRPWAFEDGPLPIGRGQTISQPFMVARMLELLDPPEGCTVLDVGCGSGYQAAVLAEMGCRVVGVERIRTLADRARAALERLGYGGRVRVEWADGRLGFPEEAPFGGIVVAAASERIEPAWEEQIAPGGRIVAPIRVGTGLERLRVRLRGLEGFEDRPDDYCRFVPLLSGREEDADAGKGSPRA
jgi:protein-L-isoaspartate(D-aspartate) O-methyltransferase